MGRRIRLPAGPPPSRTWRARLLRLRVLPVDLSGHGRPRGDLRTLTVEQCVDTVAEEIERARLDEVVLVAHSMGGLTAPGVVARLGPAHVVRLVLIAALVLPADGSVLDTLRGPVRWHVARAHRRATPRPPPPRTLARWLSCNGMTREQRDFVLEQLSAEHGPRKQRTSIDSLGGVGEIVEVDTGHDIMVSQPARSDPSHGTERRMTATGPRLTPRRAWSPEDGVGG